MMRSRAPGMRQHVRGRRARFGAASPVMAAATALGLVAAALPLPAAAQNATQIEQLQRQIQQLQADLDSLKARQTAVESKAAQVVPATTAGPATTGAAAAPASPGIGRIEVGGVRLRFGGFIEATSIFRQRNETADVGSSFNTGIPYPVSANYHLSEFRGTARQSRLSLLAQGDPDEETNLSAFFESDFLGAAPTANSVESNSYTPRLRQAYGVYERDDLGFYFLGGQAWSLITLDKTGLTPRQEAYPLTIDAQYVPGFTWTRNMQLRAVKEIDIQNQKLWLALSAESPQANISGGPITSGGKDAYGDTITYTNPGGSLFSSGTAYSTDLAPDLIAKAAYEPGWGHYELYGVTRFFRDRVATLGAGSNHTTVGGGIGAGAILPLIPKQLDFQASFLAGYGVGRYGSAQLPDMTLRPDGTLALIPEGQALLGLIGHPTAKFDLYAYLGAEHAVKTNFTVGKSGYGYGSPLYSNAGCEIENSTLGCSSNTSTVVQGTLGGWWHFYQGTAGTAMLGGQASYTRRYVFAGVGGGPSTDDTIVMASFRYFPFQ